MRRKTKYFFSGLKRITWLLTIILSVNLLFLPAVHAQLIDPPEPVVDTVGNNLLFPFSDFTGNPYLDNELDNSPLFMVNPPNIKREIIYNPETNSYEFVNKIGDFNYRPPTVMDFDEYQKYEMDNSINEYWQERSATAGTEKGSQLIPKIYVGGDAFKNVFGSNAIDIRPQGSAEVSFGVLYNNRQDPALDVRQRKTTNFDFDMRIQMNVVAKIGEKIQFKANYNTESSFDFENTLKLTYQGDEDEIIKLIEAGNVSLPLKSTLIRGSQSLFGIKTQLQFGKTTVTALFSEQQSETKNITVQGGAQTNRFQLTALDYEQNKHFFITHQFRNNYERAVASLPIITSDINITRIEVWVTNIGPATEENRNIVAFTDLGEFNQENIYSPYVIPIAGNALPSNSSNDLLLRMDTAQLRNINTVTPYLSGDPLNIGKTGYFVAGEDYVKLENARKLRTSEYTINSKLGFISLNTTLSSDQVLAISIQYTVIGYDEVFQVGEFSDQGTTSPNNLVVKLLKSYTINTKMPMWDLMMKNVYPIGAYQVKREDFRFNILYSGNKEGVPTGYFTEGPDDFKGIPLIHLFGLDNLDQQNNPVPGGDGLFDFLDGAATNGGTIQSSNGRIFFTALEPFGSYIRDSLLPTDPELADYYSYDSLYTMTKTGAEQYPSKNKYLLEGMYSSQSGSDISLNALNVPQGSVVVTAGGVPLVENVDYTVDYTLGRVTIINDGIMNSGVPINVSLENNSMFNVQQKRMMGLHFDHEFTENFHLGGTILNLHEKPLTQKVNYGDDPISNTMWGLDLSYRTESRWLTKMVNKLPGISSNEVSKINLDGEFAQFIPGHSNAIGNTGTLYIDDFEGAKSSIDLKSIGSWFMASTPQLQPDLFPEANADIYTNALAYGKNRAKFAWYIIDPLFYDRSGSRRPPNVDKNEISKNSTRQVLQNEVFPYMDIANGVPTTVAVFNMSYFPSERGPNNYDADPTNISAGINADGTLAEPASRWGGIMRKIESSDFESANIEYIEFWMMDPFTEDPDNRGELYINLGEISEDILRDGQKSYENGLPTSAEVENVNPSPWGQVPSLQALTTSFSNDAGSRTYQDAGYDGIINDEEVAFFSDSYLDVIRATYGGGSPAYVQAESDPSADDYHYYLGSDYDQEALYSSIVERYKQYNNTQGNSPTDDQNPENYPTAATNIPNVEDINNDNTLSESETYYQYKIELDPAKMKVGENYIQDIQYAQNVLLANGDVTDVKWYQFKVPVNNPSKRVGSISDFRSIRFMRMFMKGFERPITTRFATFQLVRGEWRKYQNSLLAQGEYVPSDETSETNFVSSTVNVDENSNREPIPYVVPPGIEREINYATTDYVVQNEQSLQLEVTKLLDGDARGVYKTTNFDFRQFKYINMFIHAEEQFQEENLEYGDLTVFIRIGSDFTNNYYEYELPVEFTKWYTPASSPDSIWPAINEMAINLEELVQIKENRNVAMRDPASGLALYIPYSEQMGYAKATVLGSPSLSDVKGILIGVRNPKRIGNEIDDNGNPVSAIVWVDELRLTEFNDKAGWAASGRAEATLADLGRVSVAASHTSDGFGSLEQKISQLPLESVTDFIVSTDLEMGKFAGQKAALKVPVHFDYGQSIITPEYNPIDPDVLLKTDLDTYVNPEDRDSVKNLTIDRTERINLNILNVRKERTDSKKKPHIWDIENFDVSFAYSKTNHQSIDFVYDDMKTVKGGLGYNFNGRPKNYKPLGSVKAFSSKHLSLIRDFNIYLLPKIFSFRTDMNRTFRETLYRDKSIGDVIIYPTYNRNWLWNRIFDLKYDFSKSLTFEYNAGVNAFILEPTIYPDKDTEEWEIYKQEVWASVLDFGTLNNYKQSLKINYNVPLSKIPALDWMTAAIGYTGLYNWAASATSIQERFGNTIENSAQKQLNSSADLNKLYGKVPYFKDLTQAKRRPSGPGNIRGGMPDPPDLENDTVAKPRKNYGKIIGDGLLKMLLSIKKTSFTYSQTAGTLLPGFLPQPEFIGVNWTDYNAPGLGFVFGDQKDIRANAAEYGWITTDPVLNNPYQTKFNESYGYKVNADLWGAIRVDLNGDRVFVSNYQAYYRFDTVTEAFNEFTPMTRGNYNITYSIIKTSFQAADADNISPTFQQFLDDRSTVAFRLAEMNPQWNGETYYDTVANADFPVGYGATSQQVLYYSFLGAYTGTSPQEVTININNPFPKFPFPSWTFTFNGLTNIKALAKIFKSINISTGYRSILSVASWQTNVNYDPDNPGQTYENSPNYITQYDVGVVALTEAFSPLIGFDVTFQNSLSARIEYKKLRNLTMSYVNNQLTEVIGNEILFGFGYRLKNLKLSIGSMSGGGKKTNFSSDMNFKLDIGIRDNKTTLRRIDQENNQISAGSRQFNLNFSSDYMLSKSLQLKFYLNWTSSNPYVSSQFPNSTVQGGFSLRFNLAQ
ncbi:MAG TPA: cell surface protein SprA [Bacteroidales bacterium]